MNARKLFILSFVLLLMGIAPLHAEMRSLWAAAWDINTPQKIVKVVKIAVENNFDAIFAEIRYRGDALYKPNRYDRTFPNPEPTSYFVTINDFDPLAFLLQTAKNFDIKVYAWMTTFVVTPLYTYKLPSDHIYFTHPEWICRTNDGNPMLSHIKGEGAFLDPGIPEVQRYTQDIVLDVVSNYDVDGIILDYIRYPGSEYSYNSLAFEHFIDDFTEKNYSGDYTEWKQKVISDFIRDTGAKIKFLKPNVSFAVTAKPNNQEAKYIFYQDWEQWLTFKELDYIHLMMYTKSDVSFKDTIEKNLVRLDSSKIALSLRAWDEQKTYTSEEIQSKIRLARASGFDNISIFHFGGLVANGYKLADTLSVK